MNIAPAAKPGPSRLLTIPLLVLLYPVGLVALWKSNRFRTTGKIAGSLLALPVFVLLLLLAVKPFWDFDGYFNFTSFSLDFSKGSAQYAALEDHRSKQTSPPAKNLSPALAADANLPWPDFRGPHRDGIVPNAKVSTDWSAHAPRELYRQPIGEGYASFVTDKGRAFTIEQRRNKEAITCYDIPTGRELWATAYKADFSETLGGDGPRATPTLDGDRLYALGALGDLHCVKTADGKILWHKNILGGMHQENLQWALSGAPLIVDDNVLVASSGKGGPGVVALNKSTGEIVWKSDAGTQGYVSLVLATLAGKRQVLNESATALNGIDPADGKILWSFPWPTSMGINCSQPIPIGDDRVFISSGYGQGGALIEIKKSDRGLVPQKLWANTRMKNKFSSSVVYDDHVYGLDEGVLTCLKLDNGERLWKGARFGHGSLLLLKTPEGASLLVLSEEGELAIVKTDPAKFTQLGKLQILHGRTWNNFVVLGRLLLARNHKEMVCYDLSPQSP
jgi:outer membrane protein assembly factor BamB